MWHKLRLYLLILGLAMTAYTKAYEGDEQMRISLLTCTPGEELYARFGHTAIRIYDPANKIDIVYNYGIFDFNTDHFYWKFVKGETWYELGVSSMKWFMYEYNQLQRPVYEQVLNLTPEQREEIWQALATNYEPQNRQYLYNFVFDNCATRPYHLIANALQDSIVSDYTGHTGVTYRAFIRQYTGALSMENAGITLLFGPKADQPMNSEQRLFLPEELMLFMESAHLSDGTPIVSEGSVQPFPAPVVPWYATWPFWLAVYFAFVFGMSLTDLRRHRWSKWVEIAAAIPYLLLLLIVGFLTFFSCHPLVGFGWRLLIIPFTHLCARLIYIIRH